MPITITVPSDTHAPGDTGHTTDHNTIADALTVLGLNAANVGGDTFTGPLILSSTLAVTGLATLTGGVQSPHSSLSGQPDLSQSDVTNHTANTTGFTQFSNGYSIPANDAQTGTAYIIEAWGNGSCGSTATTFSVEMTAGAAGSVTCTFAPTTSFSFSWWVKATLIYTGSSLVNTSMEGLCQTNGGALFPFQRFNNAQSFTASSTATMELFAKVSQTTGSPTWTSFHSIFTRKGP